MYHLIPQINLEITSKPGKARGCYALKTLKQDDLILKVPLSHAIWFPAGKLSGHPQWGVGEEEGAGSGWEAEGGWWGAEEGGWQTPE